jgi:hypothetical protein
MNRPDPESFSTSRQFLLDTARAELDRISKLLREEKRVIARDWATMTARERSAQSRVVKRLEEETRLLQETIELNSVE